MAGKMSMVVTLIARTDIYCTYMVGEIVLIIGVIEEMVKLSCFGCSLNFFYGKVSVVSRYTEWEYDCTKCV